MRIVHRVVHKGYVPRARKANQLSDKKFSGRKVSETQEVGGRIIKFRKFRCNQKICDYWLDHIKVHRKKKLILD